MHSARRTQQGERGFALALVLWSMALLALLGTRVVLAGHSAALIARNLVTSAQLQAKADAAVDVTIFRLLGGALPAHADPLLPLDTTVLVPDEVLE